MSVQHILIKKATYWNNKGNNKYHVTYNCWHESTQFSLALRTDHFSVAALQVNMWAFTVTEQ